MTKYILAAISAIILLLGGIMYVVTHTPASTEENRVAAVTESGQGIVKGAPVFAWLYASHERDQIPQTTISLQARYADGTSTIKEIDTVEGGCNEYPEPEADVYADSTMIICYYAGLGHYFKVVEGNGEYLVQRKIFEEGSPDYAPIEQKFETVERF